MSHDKLKEVLTRRLRLKAPLFHLVGRGRVSGSVVSKTFAGRGDSDRQSMIWNALEAELGPASVREVGMLLAYTPDEWNLRLEGTAARGPSRPARPKAQKQAG